MNPNKGKMRASYGNADDPIAVSSDDAMRSSMNESMRPIPFDLDALLKSGGSGYGSGSGSGGENEREGEGEGKGERASAPPTGFDIGTSTGRAAPSQGKMAKKGSRTRPSASGSYSSPRAGPGPSTLSQVSPINAFGALAGGSQANAIIFNDDSEDEAPPTIRKPPPRRSRGSSSRTISPTKRPSIADRSAPPSRHSQPSQSSLSHGHSNSIKLDVLDIAPIAPPHRPPPLKLAPMEILPMFSQGLSTQQREQRASDSLRPLGSAASGTFSDAPSGPESRPFSPEPGNRLEMEALPLEPLVPPESGSLGRSKRRQSPPSSPPSFPETVPAAMGRYKRPRREDLSPLETGERAERPAAESSAMARANSAGSWPGRPRWAVSQDHPTSEAEQKAEQEAEQEEDQLMTTDKEELLELPEQSNANAPAPPAAESIEDGSSAEPTLSFGPPDAGVAAVGEEMSVPDHGQLEGPIAEADTSAESPLLEAIRSEDVDGPGTAPAQDEPAVETASPRRSMSTEDPLLLRSAGGSRSETAVEDEEAMESPPIFEVADSDLDELLMFDDDEDGTQAMPVVQSTEVPQHLEMELDAQGIPPAPPAFKPFVPVEFVALRVKSVPRKKEVTTSEVVDVSPRLGAMPMVLDVEPQPDDLQVEEDVEDIRQAVNEVDIAGNGSRSRESSASIVEVTQEQAIADAARKGKAIVPTRPRRSSDRTSSRAAKGKIMQQFADPWLHRSGSVSPAKLKPKRTREEWRRIVELDGESDDGMGGACPLTPVSLPASASNGHHPCNRVNSTVSLSHQIPLTPQSLRDGLHSQTDRVHVQSSPRAVLEQPPPDRRGVARRELNTHEVDRWNKILPYLTSNPPLHRTIYESWMLESSNGELQAPEINVYNDVDDEGAPPDMEFEYSNDTLYHEDVPDPELGLGCSCEGPCDPASKTCSCLKRQELYSYGLVKGFAYDQHGRAKNVTIPIWECGPTCGCPPECTNRVVQHGRQASIKIDLFKTHMKGWGVRARDKIPFGSLLGVYSGELITDTESERRGQLYTEIGRTYLFDADGWHIANPPDLAKLRRIDPRLAYLAERSQERGQAAAAEVDDAAYSYSAYTVDAFHTGFTRYFNHSCDPNLAIAQVYVKDFHPERPTLAILARRDIQPHEELCISYKGIPDSDDEMDDKDIVKTESKRSTGRRGKLRELKASASAHVAHTGLAKKEQSKKSCFCGTPRCDGKMFNVG